MKRALAILLIFSLVLGLPALWADNGGNGGWGENVQVRVLDAYGRPVSNASVNIIWQISQTRGVVTSKTRQTNAQGTAVFNVANTEYNVADTNYSFAVTAGYGGARNSSSFTASCYSPITLSCYDTNGTALMGNPAFEPRTVNLNVFLVTFLVKDRDDKPLSVPILVDDTYLTRTDAGGVGLLALDNGTHTAVATYSGLKKSQSFDVVDDMAVNISMRLYNLAVRVLDDDGQPLGAQVYAGAAAQATDPDGWARFYNLSDRRPLINVYYGRHQKTALADLEMDNSSVMLFDTHPPVISDVQSDWKGNRLQVRAVIIDQGDYSSGLVGGNASVEIYYIASDGIQRHLPMYGVGHDLYEGLVPLEGGVQQVRYTIQAIDAEGNSGSSSDTFVVPTAAQTPGGAGTIPPVGGGAGGLGDYTIPVIFVIVLLAIAGAGYWYYRTRKPPTAEAGRGWSDRTGTADAPKESSARAVQAGQPPQAPPAAPQSPGNMPPASPPKPPM